jgi:hypothetical protein
MNAMQAQQDRTDSAARRDSPPINKSFTALALGLSLLILVAAFALLRWAPSPVETTIVVVSILLVGLTVAGYLGTRRGHAAPFVAVALLLPYLLAGVVAWGAAQRAASELEAFFGAGEDSGTPMDVGLSDENGDGVDDLEFLGADCTMMFPEMGQEFDECLANGGLESIEGEGSAPQEEGPPTQPLDGGSYTWSNGVTLTLEVARQEPWGDTDDYCGDGSCGVSNPDDLRWVLHYEVSVPEDAPRPFDPYSCPGELQIANGNDEETIINVSGDYANSLDGKILPGSTKSGDNEYSIERSALGEEFYIESSCGDPDYMESPVYFTGVIDK